MSKEKSDREDELVEQCINGTVPEAEEAGRWNGGDMTVTGGREPGGLTRRLGGLSRAMGVDEKRPSNEQRWQQNRHRPRPESMKSMKSMEFHEIHRIP